MARQCGPRSVGTALAAYAWVEASEANYAANVQSQFLANALNGFSRQARLPKRVKTFWLIPYPQGNVVGAAFVYTDECPFDGCPGDGDGVCLRRV